MDISSVIQSHINWRNMINSLYDGKDQDMIDPAIIDHPDLCELGKWLTSQKIESISDNHFYKVLDIAHQEFHHLAAEILSLYQSGQKNKADSERDRFKWLSRNMIELLKRLQEEMAD